ncbi:tetratricopeptide repeat-containing sensor histidine kinase [uncultured Chryseobacterium sp.]|uniref:ATP-binding protein n=1 Tax=uncultured Chryseobacterium sp. TaxID=259322 RepID=UPI0025D8AA90|nr:tetratricopeptide repeat-containing sensor histidine kinase [uncultured Chryseobacterium sp.]
MNKYLLFLLIIIFSCEKERINNVNTFKGNQLYKEGEELIQKDNIKAYLKFQKAIIYYKIGKDSSGISKSLIYQSIAQNYTGDILGAEATLVESLSYVKSNDKSLYSIFGNLGNINYDQKEYIEAERWYIKALKEYIKSDDEKANLLNNKSAAQYRQGKYIEAIKTLEKTKYLKVTEINLVNRIKENTVYVNWLLNKNYPIEKEIEILLNNKLKNEDFWGVNSSYSHLAEVNQIKNPSKSLFYAKAMLNNAVRIKSPEDRLEAMERIFPVDNSNNLKRNFSEYKTLSDSIQASRNDYRKSFAYIKYDSEKKENENQQLKIQNSEKEIQALQKNIGLVILGMTLIGGLFWYKKRKKSLQQEKELEVKNTQLKMSKRVHDVVANGIYQVMAKIENQEDFDRDRTLDELEFVYEKSRDISYEKAGEEKEFSQEISGLIASFNNVEVKTFTAGNTAEIWQTVSREAKEEVYQMIRELMVNMKKHSHASHVALKFEKTDDTIDIQYKDNGVGISGDLIYKNGLRNTASRMEAIGGTITFDTKIEKGLKVNLSFPAS